MVAHDAGMPSVGTHISKHGGRWRGGCGICYFEVGRGDFAIVLRGHRNDYDNEISL